jgi:hypothetical protein
MRINYFHNLLGTHLQNSGEVGLTVTISFGRAARAHGTKAELVFEAAEPC